MKWSFSIHAPIFTRQFVIYESQIRLNVVIAPILKLKQIKQKNDECEYNNKHSFKTL